MRQVTRLLFLLIITLGTFLRLYQISKYPVHLGHDEISQLYDAISISDNRKDIYGNYLPFIFKSVNDFKPPFYTYATVLAYKLFGWQDLTIKIPGLFFGILVIPAVYLFAQALFNNQWISMVAALLTAISPFEIFYSRKSFENQAGIVLLLLGLSLLIRFEKKKDTLVFSGLSLMALAMYTYFSHTVLIPLIFITWLIIFKPKIRKRTIWVIIIPLLILIPLVWNLILSQDSKERGNAVFITQDIGVGRKINFAQNTNRLLSLLGRSKVLFDEAFSRYLHQFDPIYWFGNGLDLTKQSFPDVGPLYLFQLLLIIPGIFVLFNNKNFGKETWFIIVLVLAGFIPSALTFEPFSPHRSIISFTLMNLLSAVGLVWIFRQLKYYKFRISFLVFMFWWWLWNFTYFVHLYTVNYPFERSMDLHDPFKQVAQIVWENYMNYSQIVFDPKFGVDAPRIGTAAHYYLAFYGYYPPLLMQNNYHIGNKDREVVFDKFSIRAVNWREDSSLKDTLLVASFWSLPTLDQIGQNRIIKIINFYNGQPAFYVISL